MGKIEDAKKILKEIGMPEQQQTDIAAYSLLTLTNIKPRMTSRTVDSVMAMWLNTPSKTGARRLQNPCHTADSTSVMLSNSKPRLFSRSTMP